MPKESPFRSRLRTFNESLKDNARRPCQVTGCTAPRYGLNPYCKDHVQHRLRHGNPLVKNLNEVVLHPHLTHARDVLNRYLARAEGGTAEQTAELLQGVRLVWRDLVHRRIGQALPEMATLDAAKVDPIEVLAVLVSILLYVRNEDPRGDELEYLNFQAGRQVLKLAGFGRQKDYTTRGRMRRSFIPLGALLIAAFKPAIAQCVVACESAWERQQAKLRAMSKPLPPLP